MAYEIKKARLNWRDGNPGPKLNENRVDGIALHHYRHPTANIYEVHRWHLGKGWNGYGYGWEVAFDGTITEGRGHHVGAHVLNHNSHLIGIAFQGNYHPDNRPGVSVTRSMPDAQFNAGIWLINYLRTKYKKVRVVHGHKHWTRTECPGDFFPLTELITGQYRGNTGKAVYSVQPGDTLYSVARKLGTTVEDLAKLNNIKDVNLIYPGQELIKPGVEKVAPQSVPKKDESGQTWNLPNMIISRRTNSRGNHVRRVQEALHAVYFRPGPVDGIYGLMTEDAVRRFQSVYLPYEVDGVYGPNTRAKLLERLNGR